MTELKTNFTPEPVRTAYFGVDPDFLVNFELKLIAGRNFSNEITTDKKVSIILNEKAVAILGLGTPEEAIGKAVTFGKEKSVYVIGILKDFNYRSLENEIGPMLLHYQPKYYEYASIRYLPGKKEELKTALLKSWGSLDKIHPLDCRFFDDLDASVNSFFTDLITIAGWTCGFVVFIALLGLLGMTSYSAEVRVKEVGIRKVLGATAPGITMLLSKDYVKLISISGAVATPLAYIISKLIMQAFPYRVGLSFWVFPFGLFLILALALITISTQTIKAAGANPVNSLREE